VDAEDADATPTVGAVVVDHAIGRQRFLVLRNLIALWKVGVEVVLTREDRRRLDRTSERQPGLDGVFDGRPVEHRQRARQPEAHRADVRIGRRTEPGAAAAEDLARSQQLRVNLEADYGFKTCQCRMPNAEC
jgi:hypothetical protein